MLTFSLTFTETVWVTSTPVSGGCGGWGLWVVTPRPSVKSSLLLA